MLRVGKAVVIPKEMEFEWTIHNFFLNWIVESEMPPRCYSSPIFSFADETWCLEIHPNGDPGDYKVESAKLFFVKKSCGPPIRMKYSLSLKTSDGQKYLEKYFYKTFHESYAKYDCHYLLKAKHFDRMSESDVATVICYMKCSDFEDEKTEKILDDLKGLMNSGTHSDTTIQVKGREFRLHRNILGVRNAFFDSMLKNTNTLSIDDCDSDVFKTFIHFLYTGEVDKMTLDNVHDLYEVADKYHEYHLKAECSQFMINSMCADNFCDFVVLALRHDDTKLMEKAIKVFAMKTKEIVFSMKWISFLNDYPAYARELHLRAIDANQNSLSKANVCLEGHK